MRAGTRVSVRFKHSRNNATLVSDAVVVARDGEDVHVALRNPNGRDVCVMCFPLHAVYPPQYSVNTHRMPDSPARRLYNALWGV